MTFRCRRRVNAFMPASTVMPENTAVPANTTANVLDQLRQKCTYGNITESELLCVRVVLYVKRICKLTKSDAIRQYMLSECQDF